MSELRSLASWSAAPERLAAVRRLVYAKMSPGCSSAGGMGTVCCAGVFFLTGGAFFLMALFLNARSLLPDGRSPLLDGRRSLLFDERSLLFDGSSLLLLPHAMSCRLSFLRHSPPASEPRYPHSEYCQTRMCSIGQQFDSWRQSWLEEAVHEEVDTEHVPSSGDAPECSRVAHQRKTHCQE